MESENQVKLSTVSACVWHQVNTIQHQLERFWHIEEGAPCREFSENDKICEVEFLQTHKRNVEERFEVRLPFKGNMQQLRSSREIAIKHLKAIERKFSKSLDLKEKYKNFIYEYQDLGHMTEIVNTDECEVVNYLPHHSVIKEDSLTTKLRVVFDGSSSTASGMSLNDILRVGPTVQQDLLNIILRFRQHRYVFTADIQKIYRQILLQEDQRDLQRIVWRVDPNESIRDFRLNTLTYGLASSPFLATRCLLQLAIENQENYPETSDIIRNNFYIDDLLSGGNDIQTLRRRKSELTNILNSAGIHIA